MFRRSCSPAPTRSSSDPPRAQIGQHAGSRLIRPVETLTAMFDWFHHVTFVALLATAPAALAAWPSHAQDGPPRILYFTHSAGYRHEVIPASRDILNQIGAAAGFEVTASEDVAAFTAENLRHYGAHQPAGGIPRPIDRGYGRDLSDPGFRRGRLARASAPRSEFG